MKTTETIKVPWLLGIVLLPVIVVGTILFAVVTSLIVAVAMIPLALVGKLSFTMTRNA